MTDQLSAELPAPTRTRNVLSSILVTVALAGDLLASLMLHATLGEGPVADETRQWLARRDLALPAAVGASLLAILLTGAGYLSTLDWRQRRRPMIRLLALGFGVGAVVISPVLGLLDFPAEQPLVLGLALGFCLILALVLWPLEWAVGRSLASIAALAAASKSPQAAWWARQAVRFSPLNVMARRSLGLGLTYGQQMAQAYPHLIHAYALGDRTPPLLWALAQSTESLGEWTTALNHLDELATILTEDETVLAERIRLNRQLGRPAEARNLIEQLSGERRIPWRETRLELLLELSDVPALAEEASQFEKEQGPPFPRARQILRQVHAIAPDQHEHLDTLIRLADLCGDSGDLITLLEESLEHRPGQPEAIRKLRAECLRNELTERAASLLQVLGSLKSATAEEYLELAALHASRGDDEGMMHQLEQLGGSPARTARGAAMIVRSHFESGRHEAALAAARAAREGGWLVGLPADEVAGIENRIQAQALSAAVNELGHMANTHPDDLDLQFRYLQALCESGATDKSVMLGEQLIQRHGDSIRERLEESLTEGAQRAPQGRSGRLIEYMGDLRLRAGDPSLALRHYTDASQMSMKPDQALLEMTRRILSAHPIHTPSHLVAAELEMKAGDSRAALRHLDRALELGQEIAPSSQLKVLEFQAAAQTGATQRAIAVGRDIIATAEHQDEIPIHLQLAELMMTQGMFEEACRLLENLHLRWPDNMAIRGKMRVAAERRKNARIERLRTELSTNPRSAELLEELGDLLLADGQLNEAVVEFQKAAHLGPQYRQARAKLGLCLARKGLHAEADEAYEETELQPALPQEELNALKDLFYDSALLMEKDRESDRALKLHKRISKVDMGYKDVLARIERLSRSQKRRQAI